MAKKDKDILFSANLILSMIDGNKVRFRITGEEGANVLNLHHIEFDRKEFPKDEEFNLNFINADLEKAEKPSVSKSLRKQEDITAAQKEIDKAHDKLVKKQKDYKAMTTYELIIKKAT